MDVTKSEHRQQFIDRVKAARAQSGLTQEEMAELLGMKQTSYHKYESRSYLPHALVHRFCLAARIDVASLFVPAQSAVAPNETPAVPAKVKRRRKRLKAA